MSRNQKDALALLKRLQGKNMRPGQSSQNAVAGDYFTENTSYSDGPAAGLSKLTALTPANRHRVHSAEPDVASKERRAHIENVVKPRLNRRKLEQFREEYQARSDAYGNPNNSIYDYQRARMRDRENSRYADRYADMAVNATGALNQGGNHNQPTVDYAVHMVEHDRRQPFSSPRPPRGNQ